MLLFASRVRNLFLSLNSVNGSLGVVGAVGFASRISSSEQATGITTDQVIIHGEKLFVFLTRYPGSPKEDNTMNNIIYIVGLVVVVGAILAFFGLR